MLISLSLLTDAVRWKPQDLRDDKSTLFQVMAWCRQDPLPYRRGWWQWRPGMRATNAMSFVLLFSEFFRLLKTFFIYWTSLSYKTADSVTKWDVTATNYLTRIIPTKHTNVRISVKVLLLSKSCKYILLTICTYWVYLHQSKTVILISFNKTLLIQKTDIDHLTWPKQFSIMLLQQI